MCRLCPQQDTNFTSQPGAGQDNFSAPWVLLMQSRQLHFSAWPKMPPHRWEKWPVSCSPLSSPSPPGLMQCLIVFSIFPHLSIAKLVEDVDQPGLGEAGGNVPYKDHPGFCGGNLSLRAWQPAGSLACKIDIQLGLKTGSIAWLLTWSCSCATFSLHPWCHFHCSTWLPLARLTTV